MQTAIPDWADGDPLNAVRAYGSRSGWVATETDHAALDEAPIEEVVARAKTIAGRTEHILVEADPFLGLVRDDPDRALASIERSTASHEEVAEALSTMLREDEQKPRKTVTTDIAGLLIRVNDNVFAAAIRAIGSWLKRHSQLKEVAFDPALWNIILDRGIDLVGGVERDPIETVPRRTDWMFHAINSPAGNFAEVLMGDDTLPSPPGGAGLPDAWRVRAEHLLRLPEPHASFALVIFASRLPYLFAADCEWVCRWLVPAVADDRRPIMLASFRYIGGGLSRKLFAILTPILVDEVVQAAMSSEETDDHLLEWIGTQLLRGWINEVPGVGDDEMRTVLARGTDAVRAAVLDQCSEWLRNDETPKEGRPDLKARLIALFRSVWPKQATAQRGRTNGGLVSVIFAAGEDLPTFKDVVEPFVARGARWPELHWSLKPEVAATQFPEEVLSLLDRAAPAAPTNYWSDFHQVLDAIAEADPNLDHDPRMYRLRAATLH